MNRALKSTRIFEPSRESLPRWRSFVRASKRLLTNVWTSTDFDEPSITRYAENAMLAETRRGITIMAVLSLAIQVSAIALYQKLGVSGGLLYTYGLLALLSIHVIASARFVSDLSALNLLGMVLLIFTGVAIMTIAHSSGSVNAGLMSSIVLLFMVMPIVPWALREAGIIVGLTYLTLTFSFLSVQGRFDAETLWTAQFLILASAATAMLSIARNTIVRRDEMRSRFELEDAHRELELISTSDPLTGAWNRRFIENNFGEYAQRCYDAKQEVKLALLDIDNFKHFNDTFGHHHGDQILRHLAKVFIDTLPGDSHLIRLGGDEFAILHSGDGFKQLISRCLNHLYTNPILLADSDGEPVTVTVGFATSDSDAIADLTALYKAADEALYAAKNTPRPASLGSEPPVNYLFMTGSIGTKA